MKRTDTLPITRPAEMVKSRAWVGCFFCNDPEWVAINSDSRNHVLEI